MAKRKKTYYVRIRKGKRRNKESTKRSTDIKHVPKEKQYLDCASTEQKIDVLKQEHIEVTIESGYNDKKDDDESRNDTLRQTPANEKNYVLKQEQIEVTIESDDDDKKDDDASRNGTLRQTPVNEKIDVLKQEHIEVTIEGGYDDKKDDDESRNYTLRQTPVSEKIFVLKQEQIEKSIESDDDGKKDDDESRNDAVRQTPVSEKMYVLKQEQIEMTFESEDDDKKDDDESRTDTLRQTPVNEELWLVRKQLCRCCHSDGAFWSLQTRTEGDTYGDLLQRYFNIQLYPVHEPALSAICALCAARLREARTFSAQALAAEERFTRMYKQNRVRALVNEVEIKKDIPKIINEVDDFKIKDDVEPNTANSKSVFRLSPSDYERVGNLFKCRRCSGKLYNRKGIHNHVKNVHLKSRKYTCPSCDKTFTNLGDFRSHKNICITNKKNLKKVDPLSPSDFERVGNSYKCTRCEKQVRDYTEVRDHVMYTHLKLPRYTCPHCDKTFNGLAPFTKHKLEEHSIDDRIKCNACDWSTYLSKTVLTKHKNAFHMLGVKQNCPDCDYFCFSASAMKKHAVKHSTVKKHQCKFCKKAFLRKNNLNCHEKIHTGDKRKVCNVCGQAFVQRASLTYHMAKHHPEVRF